MLRNRTLFLIFLLARMCSFGLCQELGEERGGFSYSPTNDPISNITLAKGFGGRTFTIAVHEEHPFVFYNESLIGNARFTGATVDILSLLSENLDFTMQLNIVRKYVLL